MQITPVTQYVPEIRLVHNPQKHQFSAYGTGKAGTCSPSAADGARAILARRRALPMVPVTTNKLKGLLA